MLYKFFPHDFWCVSQDRRLPGLWKRRNRVIGFPGKGLLSLLLLLLLLIFHAT